MKGEEEHIITFNPESVIKLTDEQQTQVVAKLKPLSLLGKNEKCFFFFFFFFFF
jgi:hypothetical protein